MYQKLNTNLSGQSESAYLRPVPMDLEQLRSLAESESSAQSVPFPVGPELRPVPFDLEQISLPEPEACEIARARQKPEPVNTSTDSDSTPSPVVPQVKRRAKGMKSRTRSTTKP